MTNRRSFFERLASLLGASAFCATARDLPASGEPSMMTSGLASAAPADSLARELAHGWKYRTPREVSEGRRHSSSGVKSAVTAMQRPMRVEFAAGSGTKREILLCWHLETMKDGSRVLWVDNPDFNEVHSYAASARVEILPDLITRAGQFPGPHILTVPFL